MKRRRSLPAILFAVVVLVLAGFAYIQLATLLYDGEVMAEAAWRQLTAEGAIQETERLVLVEAGWEDAEVELVAYDPPRIPWSSDNRLWISDVSRRLLFLNRNQAVRVVFRTGQEGLLGPLVVYVNPFTRAIVGMDPRF